MLDADITTQPAQGLGLSKDAGMLASEYGIIPTTCLGIKLMSINSSFLTKMIPLFERAAFGWSSKAIWGEVDWRDLDYMIVTFLLEPGTCL